MELEKIAIVIGEGGTGKSTLCNVLSGHVYDSSCFRVAVNYEKGTENTVIKKQLFLGDEKKPFTIIDTPGFNDPDASKDSNANQDREIVNELMKKLTSVDHINLFVICINEQNISRMHESLRYMLNYFKDIFGVKMERGAIITDINVFWERCFIVITKMPLDEASVKRRLKATKNVPSQEHFEKVIAHLKSKVLEPDNRLKITNFAFIDAHRDVESTSENETYMKECQKLYHQLCQKSPARTRAMQIAHSHSAISK